MPSAAALSSNSAIQRRSLVPGRIVDPDAIRFPNGRMSLLGTGPLEGPRPLTSVVYPAATKIPVAQLNPFAAAELAGEATLEALPPARDRHSSRPAQEASQKRDRTAETPVRPAPSD